MYPAIIRESVSLLSAPTKPVSVRRFCTRTTVGMLSMPKMSIYSASKWCAIGWSDSVRLELQRMKSHVRITTVAPYFINTGMFDGVRSKVFPILDPEKTAAKIIKSIEHNKTFAGIPFSFHFIRLMEGMLPQALFDWFYGDVFGIYNVMDGFTGRKSLTPQPPLP